MRLRRAVWPGAGRGTVAVFQGRAEFAEKYARLAVELTSRGFAVVTWDWRGQGLSDRPPGRPMTGHIRAFRTYQHDVDAVLQYAGSGPLVVLGHSMGGAIALRALHRGIGAAGAVFSAPLWGLDTGRAPVGLVRGATYLGAALGFGPRMIPGGSAVPYIASVGFAENTLTGDEARFEAIRAKLAAAPDLALGAPSFNWVNAAFREAAALRRAGLPDLPSLTVVGSEEEVVSVQAIRAMVPPEDLTVLAEARHEPFQETATVRQAAWDALDPFLDRVAPG